MLWRLPARALDFTRPGAASAHLLRSRLAVATKFTLDQLLGAALWHAALLTIDEPYRQAGVRLLSWAQGTPPPPTTRPGKQR